jgi:UDP-glucose 4-epimerase
MYVDVSLAEKVRCWKAKYGLSEMLINAWGWQQQLAHK